MLNPISIWSVQAPYLCQLPPYFPLILDKTANIFLGLALVSKQIDANLNCCPKVNKHEKDE